MAHYLNNSQNRDHVALFGADAFFDLSTDGAQAAVAYDIRPQDFCVVASQSAEGVITLCWYKFAGFRIARDNLGANCRVFCGTFVKSESMSKSEASTSSRYSRFFDKNGNFKRQSVL